MRKTLLGLALVLLLGAGGSAWALESFKTVVLQSAAGATGDGTAIDTPNYTSIALQVVISNTATVTFEGTVDGSTWVSAVCTSTASTSATLVTSATASGMLQCPVAGLAKFRARVSAWTSGTVTVTGRVTTAVLGKKGGSGGGSGAPTDATYITQTADGTLSAEQALGSLSSGCLSVTTTTGVVASTGAGCVPVSATFLTQTANATLTGEQALGSLASGCLSVTTTTGVIASSGAACGGSVSIGGAIGSSGLNGVLISDASGELQELECSDGEIPTWASGIPVCGTVDVAASTVTLTNKTLNAESTGNVITLPKRLWFPAAACNNATAGPIWDLPASNPAVAACVTGTNTQIGVLDFANTGSLSAQTTYILSAPWTGTIDARFKWFTSATSGSVVWQLATICVADAETDDPAFNTASTVTDAAKGTTNQTNDAAITGVTITGCAAGELMHIKILRDSGHASDDLAATARLIGVELVIREAM